MFVTLGRIAQGKTGRDSALWRRRRAGRRIERAQRRKRDRPGPREAHPRGRGMDSEGAQKAGMGQSVMAKGQQNHLDVDRPKTRRPGLRADEERLRFVGDAIRRCNEERNRAQPDRLRAKARGRKDLSAP